MLPAWDELWRVVLLSDYNTRVVVLGTTMLGLAAGTIGSFMLLRKQALIGDALSHATLPGIAMAFMVTASLGGSGKSLPVLLAGAVVTGVLGLGCVQLLTRMTRLKEDAAMGIVLSVFFGAGIALLGIVQKMQTGHAAGLESFIYGKTAAMLASDAKLIALAATLVIGLCAVLFKELKILCFDAGYAQSQGYPVLALDLAMMTAVVLITVIGLQAVGLILIIALLIIPPAAARFWTRHMLPMVVIAAVIGAVSAFVGASLSALLPRLPSGAMIVLVSAGAFAVSMIFAPARGVLSRWVDHRRLRRTVARHDLMRTLYERYEAARPQGDRLCHCTDAPFSVTESELFERRAWSAEQLRSQLRRAQRDGLVRRCPDDRYELTAAGFREAMRATRNYRLWGLFLVTHADIAAAHVDQGAERVEHVLDPEMVAELEALLMKDHPDLATMTVPGRPA